jgi:hypothetical protein
VTLPGRQQAGFLRRLDLRVEEIELEPGRPRRTVVTILVDGEDIFTHVDGNDRYDYMGWHPALLLNPDIAPLLPVDPARRVGLYPGRFYWVAEACITARITGAGDRVTWSDFRDITGYHGPADQDMGPGVFLGLPDLVFDAAQYRAEVERATADRFWETDDLKTARLVRHYLLQAGGHLAASGWRPDFAEARPQEFWVVFQGSDDTQLIVELTPEPGTPEQQAAAMSEFLLATPPEQWPVAHCSRCGLTDPPHPRGPATDNDEPERPHPNHRRPTGGRQRGPRNARHR